MMMADVEIQQRLRVPALWCPVPEALHPAWRQMQAGAVAWMHRYGLARGREQANHFAAIGAGELGARVTADAVDIEHAVAAMPASTDTTPHTSPRPLVDHTSPLTMRRAGSKALR
jgi:hypothetical protein